MRQLCLAGVLALSGCATADLSALRPAVDPAQLDFAALSANARRAIDDNYADIPFATGPVYVVAEEHGDLQTFRLTACGGTRICGGSGHVGTVTRTPDYFVVSGAYRDRIFYLSPGGDGHLTVRGVERELAWN